jgi:hypothetical protein
MLDEFGLLPWSLSVVFALAVMVPFAWMASRAFGRLRATATPRVLRTSASLRPGPATVEGILEGGKAPLVELRMTLEEVGAQLRETSRSVRVAPMALRLADGTLLEISAGEATLIAPDLARRARLERSATARAGDRAWVRGVLVAPASDGAGTAYRTPSKSTLVLAGDPAVEVDLRCGDSGKTPDGVLRRRWGALTLVGLLAVQLVFFGDLWALTIDGQACDATVRDERGSLSVTGGGRMLIGSGSRSGRHPRSVRAHVDVATTEAIVFGYTLANGAHGVGSQDVSEDVFVRYVVGDAVPVVVAPHFGVARLGRSPGVQPAVLVVAAFVTALFLALMRGRLPAPVLPWFAQRTYVEAGPRIRRSRALSATTHDRV